MARAEARVTAVMLLLSAAVMGVAMAENFIVGGETGWVVPRSDLSYAAWTEGITAHVGDTLSFNYDRKRHDVMKVDQTTYSTCDVTAGSLQSWDDGGTAVLLEEAGTHYFICGAPYHCMMGQAFAIEVHPVDASDEKPKSSGAMSPSASPDVGQASFITVPQSWIILVSLLTFCIFNNII
ncbi:unnamed protein product [Calypogeia fissa]